MKKLFFILLTVIFFSAQAADRVANSFEPARFDFRVINVAQLIQLIYGEALRDSYVIDPEVLTDQRSVSFRYDGTAGELRPFIRSFFDSLGIDITRRNGVDFISRKQPKPEQIEEKDVFVYRPKYRSGSYLVDLVAPLLKGEFTAKRAVRASSGEKLPQASSPPGSAASTIDRDTDSLVFSGSKTEISTLEKILSQIDIPSGELLVKAVVYEVQTGRSDGTAFGLAASVLGGKLGIKLGTAVPLENSLSLGPVDFRAVFSALSADNRFKVMSSPSVRVKSGKNARFTVGQDVPVLGALSFPQGAGQAVQAVEYRSSGVILDLMPSIRESVIDLDLTQQLSNFVTTKTGVNNSPTLIKRELKTTITSRDGDLILIGGLSEDKHSETHSSPPFLPSLFHSNSVDDSKTELLLVMQINKI